MRKNLFYVVIVVCSLLFFTKAQAIVLGEKPWDLRSGEYAPPGDRKICILSPHRTGSTVTYNLIRLLFDTPYKKCIKAHGLFEGIEACTVLICVRNPLDSGYSWCRVMMDEHKKEITQEDLDEVAAVLTDQFTACKYALDHYKSVFLLRYEVDQRDVLVLLSKVEEMLQISVKKEDKQLVKSLLSKKAVLGFLQEARYKDFSECNAIDHIHGNHIATVENDSLQASHQWIQEELRKRFLQNKDLFMWFGYDLTVSYNELQKKS
ncbi:MAG: hypothetical protein FJZ58_05125 [Chlamydiae bacterium]|nr:hypothetical protein [Chlamydiota bacterium]